MTNSKNSLTLSKIQICAYSPDDEVAREFPAYEIFDDRHDFPISSTQSGVAVMMIFCNERKFTTDNVSGVRRSISVSIVDTTAGNVMSTTTLRVNIPRDNYGSLYRVDLPLAYANINTGHSYQVLVKDKASGMQIGEVAFNLYDTGHIGNDPSLWYEATKGSIVPDWTSDMHKVMSIEGMTGITVRFDVEPRFKELPEILPELEIRLYSPGGKLKRCFCNPDCDDFDMNEYHVGLHFIADPHDCGIYYAELLCMEYPVAGFAFSTDGPVAVEGYYYGKQLECLGIYTPEAAVERFKSCMESHDDATTDDDPFERALDEFIASETKTLETEHYTFDDEADEEANATAAEDEPDTPDEATDSEPDEAGQQLCCLDHLVGLTAVKEKLGIYEKIVKFNKLRENNDLTVSSLPLHAMFLGSPGTGKTTVAKMMGVMLKRAGVLSRGHVVVKERANLLGPYYSNEETNTLKAIEEAQGGILLIDEAYQLYQPDDPRDPGKFVIEALMTALSDESKRDWMLILAGYKDEMKLMFNMNPGLKSRIPDSNIYLFDDFTEQELMEIADRYLERKQYTLSPDARVALSCRLNRDYLMRDKNFGNARHVINMIQTEILPAMAVRVVAGGMYDKQSLSEIQASDIPVPVIAVDRPRRIGYCA